MGMGELEQALALVRAHPDDADFVGPRSEELLAAAESALGLTFSPTYRRFLSELGAGGIASEEIYGLIDDEFVHASVPNGIWLTLKLRREAALDPSLVVVYSTGGGEYFALDTSRINADGECPVVVSEPRASQRGLEEVIAPDFGSFFLDRVEEALSDS